MEESILNIWIIFYGSHDIIYDIRIFVIFYYNGKIQFRLLNFTYTKEKKESFFSLKWYLKNSQERVVLDLVNKSY